MKTITNFVKYNNLLPIVLGVVFLGGGAALAAPHLGEMIGVETQLNTALLINTNIEGFDISPTVTAVEETDTVYLISYELRTLAPNNGSWDVVLKSGQFSIAKNDFDASGLEGKLVARLRDLERTERDYLLRAQATEQNLLASNSSGVRGLLAGLIGKTSEQIHVPEQRRPYFEMEDRSLVDMTEDKDIENNTHSSSSPTLTDTIPPINSTSTSTSSPEENNASSTPNQTGTSTSPAIVKGCMDSEATNHNSDATENDDSCRYASEEPEVIVETPVAETPVEEIPVAETPVDDSIDNTNTPTTDPE